ncbi:MAG: alanine racemase [Verrucomicrobiota bacterium]|nr:alanine racemase [Verrucomicrobiota bacterium]
MKKNGISHPAWIEVDLEQFRKNLQVIRGRIGKRLLCLPLKANAYGHGLVPMALAAEEFGVDVIAVSCLKEGAELRRAGVRSPILVFGAIHEEQIGDLIEHGLEFSLSSKFKAELVAKKCREKELQCSVHLEVDTGMRRTGMRPETALTLFEELKRHECFRIRGIYSHLATADEPADPFAYRQIEAFAQLREKIGSEGLVWHLANSGGVSFYPESYFDMVRPGLLCYGLTPNGSEEGELRPLFSLKAKVSYFKVVGGGEGISYGHIYKTKEQTRVVTVPVGYGDGYSRSLSNRAKVLIRGRLFGVAGRICMDQFMVDVGKEEVYVGDEVTLIGRQGEHEISLWDIARMAETDPREILCHFNDRIPRYYVRDR